MTAKNGTRLLKPAIVLKRPDRRDEGNHDKKINVVLFMVFSVERDDALPESS